MILFTKSEKKNVYLAILNVCRKPPVWREDRSCPQLCSSWTEKYHVIWSPFISLQTKELNEHTQFCSILFHFLTKIAKCQNNRVFHTLHLPIVRLFKIWQWTCLVKQLLCPCIRWSKVWPNGAIFRIPVLLSLKNNLKTNGFLTENAAKAKCPVWGKGSKGKMVIGLSELHNGQRLPPKWTKLTQLFLVYEKVWPKQRDFWNIKTSLW